LGFFLLVLYLALTYLRPWDLYPDLAQFRLAFWVGNLGIGFSLISFLAGGAYSVLTVPALYFMTAFFGVLIASPAIATGWMGGMAGAFTESMVNVLTCFLILLSARSIGKIRTVGAVICGLLMLVAIQGAFAYYAGFHTEELVLIQRFDQVDMTTGVRAEFGRVRGLGQLNDPNDLAQAIIVAAPLLWPLWRSGRTMRNFWLVILPSMVLFGGVFLTRSRGGFLSILIIIVLRLRERMTRFKTIAPVAAAGFLGLAMVAMGFTGGRDMQDSSSEGRLEAWYDGVQMLKAHPLFGVGFDNFTDHHVRVAHNSFVHCFAELGAIGYFFWIGLLIAIHTDLYAMRTPDDEEDEEQVALSTMATSVRYCLYAFLSGAFFLSRTYSTALYTVVGLAIALSAIGRSWGVVTTDWGKLLLRSALTSSLSIAGIYVFVMVVK
jgi:putative inorganic carbon (HCO3(-)) transporter